MAHGEAEAHPCAHRLNGEEGLEHAPAGFGCDPAPRVADLHDGATLRVSRRGDVNLVRLAMAHGDGVRSVAEQVDEDLPQAALVGEHAGHGSVGPPKARAVAELAECQIDAAVERRLERDGGAAISLGARKGHEAAHDLADPFFSVSGLEPELLPLGALFRRGASRGSKPLGDELDVGRDAGERIVDLVRDSACKRADGRQPVGDDDLALELLSLARGLLLGSDVAHHEDGPAGSAVELAHRRQSALHGALDAASRQEGKLGELDGGALLQRSIDRRVRRGARGRVHEREDVDEALALGLRRRPAGERLGDGVLDASLQQVAFRHSDPTATFYPSAVVEGRTGTDTTTAAIYVSGWSNGKVYRLTTPSTSPVPGTDWPTFMGSNARTGNR